MDSNHPNQPDLPLTVTECQKDLDELKAFKESPLYIAFIKYIRNDISVGISNATSMSPASIGDFVMREQGFGGLKQLNDFLTWFDDREQALKETKDEIAARSKHQLTDSSDE